MADGSIYRHAQVPRCLTDLPGDGLLVSCLLEVAAKKIVRVEAETDDPVAPGEVDLEWSVVLPGLLDAHVHLDKAFTWSRAPNPRGQFWDAIEVLTKDKANWTEDDLHARANFGLRCAEAHGTVAMRTHLDGGLDWGGASADVFTQLHRDWAGRVDLQYVLLCGIEQYGTAGGREMATRFLQLPGSLLGGMPQMGPDLDAELDSFFALAQELEAGADFHVDENGEAGAECLRRVAEAVLRNEFPHPVTCGHCCSLAVQDPARALETIELVRQAGIQVISLPMCNLYLQDRPGPENAPRTPRWRGVTLLHELAEAGVTVAAASDNVRDAFFAWGDFDLFEVLIQSIRIAHLDTSADFGFPLVTTGAATIMGMETFGSIQPGADSRLLAFPARTVNELIARPSQLRRLLGFHPDASLPSYEELGELSTDQPLVASKP